MPRITTGAATSVTGAIGQTASPPLTREEQNALASHLEEWHSASKPERKKILKAAMREVRLLAPKLNERLRNQRKKMYKDWFYNQTKRKRRSKKGVRFGKKWTARTVIEMQRKEEVLNETGAKAGDKEMIGNYQRALNTVIQGLTDEELKAAEETALEWSNEGPPREIQVEFAYKRSGNIMEEFARKLYKDGGMRVAVLWGFQDVDGSVVANVTDFNQKLQGRSFTKSGDMTAVIEDWKTYIQEEFDQGEDEDGDNDNEPIPRKVKSGGRRTKKDGYSLFEDEDGHPIIPDFSNSNLETKKSIIRAFLTVHYRMCCGKPKATVPWAAIRDDRSEFIADEYLPHDIKLKDPSKLQSSEADDLLDYWHERQENGQRPAFTFKAWMNSNKNMEKPVWMSDSDFGSGEGEERDDEPQSPRPPTTAHDQPQPPQLPQSRPPATAYDQPQLPQPPQSRPPVSEDELSQQGPVRRRAVRQAVKQKRHHGEVDESHIDVPVKRTRKKARIRAA